jgi:hypothetical protein
MNKINIMRSDLHNRLQQNTSYLKLTILAGAGGIYEVGLEMASCGMICFPSFMKIGTGVQALLRFCLSNLRCCNVGTHDEGIYEVTEMG